MDIVTRLEKAIRVAEPPKAVIKDSKDALLSHMVETGQHHMEGATNTYRLVTKNAKPPLNAKLLNQLAQAHPSCTGEELIEAVARYREEHRKPQRTIKITAKE